jgi:hypothetical protein
VQVTLEAPSRLVRGGDDPGARSGQLGAALGVRDGGSQQLGELGETVLCAIGEGPSVDAIVTNPQTAPSTVIGAAATLWSPSSRALAAKAPRRRE